jgi:hypothetical protein
MMKHVVLTRIAEKEAEREALERGNAELKRVLYGSRFITNPQPAETGVAP